MDKIELLMPAGDLTRLKIALLYGGDAVFIGGKHFSLRAKASNFTLKDIEEGVKFAHALNKKVYVTVNIVPHYRDLEQIEEYLKALDKIHVDALIVSSLYIISLIKKLNLNLEAHVSTQVSAMNQETLMFYKSLGATRVVLARECTLPEINALAGSKITEIEVFIHGGLCSSISGRCSLSNYMVLRDANRGGCAHSCRWEYHLYQDNQLVSPDSFPIGSKDLCGIKKVPDLIEANVSSLKIEGRMKSAYYLAKCAKIYKSIIDSYYNHTLTEEMLNIKENELNDMENRPLTEGYLKQGEITPNDLIHVKPHNVKQRYLGYVDDYDEITQKATIIRKNDIRNGQKIKVICYDQEDFIIDINGLSDDQGMLEIANKTENIVYFNSGRKLKKYYLLEEIE